MQNVLIQQAPAASAAAGGAAGTQMLSPLNLGLSASVASNALTLALKGVDGADPSASNKVYIPFRNVTAGTGTPSVLTVEAATSLVISSGSTLGAPTGSVAFKVWVVAFNDGGTIRLGAILCTTLASKVLTQYPLAAWGVASATAEGGAGAADSAQTFYSGATVTDKAYTVLGVLSFEAGLTTAGTWDAAPTRVQLFDPSVPLPGRVVQRQRFGTGETATGTTVIPNDDTIPQNTEGDEYMSDIITPTSAANVIEIEHLGSYLSSATNNMTACLFRDSDANAIAAQMIRAPTATAPQPLTLNHAELAGSTSAITYKIRAGGQVGGTTRLNGYTTARIYGGAYNSTLTLREVSA